MQHPLQVSDFFSRRIERLEECFDLVTSERAKELLIDTVLEETLIHHHGLKAWKAAPLSGKKAKGAVDYLLAPARGYLATPFLCIVEAKKDDFTQGQAQCLVEMKECQ